MTVLTVKAVSHSFKVITLSLFLQCFIVGINAQGTVFFDNLGLGMPIYDEHGTGPGVYPNAHAALFLNGNMIPGSLTTFLGNTDPAAQYVSALTVAIPGVTPGDPVTLQVGAWVGPSTYQNSGIPHGMSAPFTVVTGGAGEPPSLPADLTGFQSFTTFVIMPEPSTVTLLLVGATGLLFGRPKQRNKYPR